jgi:hypothetical protein
VSALGLLTAKPLAAATLALALASGLLWLKVRDMKAQRDVACGTLQAMTVSRDAYKVRVDELVAANRAYDASFATLSDEYKRAQGEARRLEEEGRAALAAAEARARDADVVLKLFMDRHAQQLRAPDCQHALASVQASCPALEGY